MKYSKETVFQLGVDITFRKPINTPADARRKLSMIGQPSDCFTDGVLLMYVTDIWDTIYLHHVNKPQLNHLFWTPMYLIKLYLPPIDIMVIVLNTCRTMLNNQVWKWVYDIALRRGDFIKWEKCNHNLPDYVIWYKVTIDGIDFCIGELVSFDKAWKSPKAKGALVKYELGVSIYSGDIAGWIYEPHVGHKHNLNIPQGIATAFVQGWYGMVETDAGYKGEAEFIQNKYDYQNDTEKKEKPELRARQETVNRQFKQWGISQQGFRNNKTNHHTVFYTIAVLTQIDIGNRNIPFSVGVTVVLKKRITSFRLLTAFLLW